ncbi:MAG TPA: cytochrome c biogenesis protein CcdA [Candidatus Limnocylindrales bacterium]|jgi:cytochrome c-type biogenesis protein|nr:cytochrome c biogenesis protein CcdA [Candidatus Limnocylindrales bacterium]
MMWAVLAVSGITTRCEPRHVDIAPCRDILFGMETLAATFLLGLGSAASPCLLPLYPGFIAYLAGTNSGGPRHREAPLLGLAVLAGLLTTMIIVGAVLWLVAAPFGDVLRWSVPIVTVVLVGLGLVLLAGRNPFARLAGVRVPVVRMPLGQAYVYGLVVGPMALPCAGPFLVALLAISVGLVDGLTRVGSFVVYGLGFGLPLVALAAIGAARGQAVSRVLARHHLAVFRAAGALLILTALYELLAAGLL